MPEEGISEGAERPIERALLSVSDKTGIVPFARRLRDLGVKIVSTGGTARALREGGVDLVEIEEFTGFPEILDGRVKTLHPRVHAGILYRRDDQAHVRTMADLSLEGIDLVAVNLYPFEDTIARPGATREEAIEEIDVGGPCLVRSAAKNHAFVTVVTSPSQYDRVIEEMVRHGGATTLRFRKELAVEAFRRTAAYDAAIERYLWKEAPLPREPRAPAEPPEARFPKELALSFRRAQILRYGENPHQSAALYGSFLSHFRQVHGKELSYNNILDLAAAEEVVEALSRFGPAAVIVKHLNPCGVGVGADLVEAWKKALATDPASASGGIAAFGRPVDARAAAEIADRFLEIVAAPEFSREALDLLSAKKNRILLEVLAPLSEERGLSLRSVPGGLLVQTADERALEDEDLRVVTRRAPTEAEMRALRFAWEVVRFVRSNAIVFTSEDRTLGIGAGQMSRVDSVRVAVLKARQAGLDLAGSAVASDAFFPFADGLLEAADAGATAAIQPGGSIRDREVIEAADSRGMAMVFTGVRHFRH